MNQQDHLFENSKQLSQKLAVALTRFFLDGPLDPSLEERYRQFLRRRPFTALQWILHQGTPGLLERYLTAGWISRQDLERGLAQDDPAIRQGRERGQDFANPFRKPCASLQAKRHVCAHLQP